MNKCVFYDMGHGGINPNTGAYTTAPSKQYNHEGFNNFHNGSWFYEGVKNREYGYQVVKNLRDAGVNVIVVSHEWQDTDLYNRVLIANEYHNRIQNGIFISEHSNAITGPKIPVNKTATGFSIWTSIGQTKSDTLAQKFYDMYVDKFSHDSINHVKAISDLKDGDNDYENNFYVLRETVMPAVLMENLFFDHIKDATTLMSADYKKKYTDLQTKWILWALEQ